MICPKCDSSNTWVFRTNTGPAVSRQHACTSCDLTWWSDAKPRQGSFVEGGAKDMNAKRLTHICATNGATAQKEVIGESLQERSDLRSDQASSKPADAPAMELTQFQFPVVGGEKVWFAPKARDAEWRKAFPGLDVTGEYRKAYAWLQANPTKRKTPRGMSHFLFGWLERAQNRGGVSPIKPEITNKAVADLAAATERRLAAQRQVTPATAEQLEELRRRA